MKEAGGGNLVHYECLECGFRWEDSDQKLGTIVRCPKCKWLMSARVAQANVKKEAS